MAGGKMRVGVVLVACLALLIQSSFAATSHTVGGTTGWTSPSSSSVYSTWASTQTFKVGDSLVFNFATGQHTVDEVSKSDYDSCSSSNPISTTSTGPATIKLSTAGTHYYICSIPGHCSNGQKLAVTVSGTSSATPSPSPTTSSPSPTTTSAPTPATSPSGSADSPSGATVPTTLSPTGSTTAPAPSSATVAGAGAVLPFMLIAAALFV